MLKYAINKVKRQATVRKNIFAMHITDRNQYPGCIIINRKKEGGKVREIKIKNKTKEDGKEKAPLPIFPPEFLNICSREILLPISDGDTDAGVNGQATVHNDSPRQPSAGDTGGLLIPQFPLFLEGS